MPDREPSASKKKSRAAAGDKSSKKSTSRARKNDKEPKALDKESLPPAESIPECFAEYPDLASKVSPRYYSYIETVISHPMRQFQKSTVDQYIETILEKGLPAAVSRAIDSRDYNRGNTWEQAQMNIMNAILPPRDMLIELLEEAIAQGEYRAVKWYAESCGNPKKLASTLVPILEPGENRDPRLRFWAAIHLSKHASNLPEVAAVLMEAIETEWTAGRLDNSTSGLTGKGEAAKALARLSNTEESSVPKLLEQLDSGKLGSADASEIIGALLLITKDLDLSMEHASRIACHMLHEKRGTNLHEGDRELLRLIRRLLPRWKEANADKSFKVDESIEPGNMDNLLSRIHMIESEIKYHLPG